MHSSSAASQIPDRSIRSITASGTAATSALVYACCCDVLVQAQVVNLLAHMQDEFSLA
jgi:hypothetical protein